MKKPHIIKQLEFYSNTIVSFIVLQGLAFSYNFGTNKFFNETIKTNKDLALGLVIVLSVTMIIGFIANLFISQKIIKLIGSEHSGLAGKIYIGKLFIIVFFGSLPALVLYLFGFLAEIP